MVMLLPLLFALACHPPDDSGQADSDRPDDTGPFDTATHDTGQTQGCVPDGDGRIEWVEFVADPGLGIQATYTTNTPGTTVDVPSVGGTAGQAGYVWDFSAVGEPTDQSWTVAIQPVEEAWFAESFPGATYQVGLDASEDTVGVYRVDDESERLELLGLATSEPQGGVLVYEEPVVVFEFPLVLDRAWESERVQADGLWEGEEYPTDYGWAGVVTLHHSYAFELDRSGVASVPMADFDVLRLRSEQRIEAINSISGSFAEQTQISYFYVAECTGLVARIRSEEGETDPDFEQASEYLRLGF